MAEGGPAQAAKIKTAMMKISGSENMREEMSLVVGPNACWEDFLDPAPMCICLLGELMAISTKTDFSLASTPPRDGFKLMEWPGSFRASLVQVVNNGWDAFNTAHTNMDQIRLMSGNVPGELKKAVKILIEGSNEELEQLLPIPLMAIQRTADRCYTLASNVEEKFVKMMSLTAEILEASTGARGKYEQDQKENEIALRISMENKTAFKEQQQMSQQMYEECKKSVKKAEKSYYDAVDQMPSGWSMIGMNTVEGISGAFTTALSGASRILTLGLGKGSEEKSLVEKLASEKSSSAVEHGPALDESTARAYEKTSLLKSYTETLLSVSTDDGMLRKDLGQPMQDTCIYAQKQYANVLKDARALKGKNPVVECINGLCKEGIEICKQLIKYAKDFNKEDKKAATLADKLGEKLSCFYEKIIALHVEGTNLMGACPTEMKAPKQSMMHPPIDKDAKTSQQLVQNARFKIEQTSAQFEFMQERYDRACDRMAENNKKVGEVMAEIAKLNIENIAFEKIRETLLNGMKALGKLREQWGKLVRFFQMMSNLIKCCLKESLEGFLAYAKQAQQSQLNSMEQYPITNLKRDLIYDQAFEAVKIAHIVNMISGSYVEISNQHLMDRIAGLATILGYDSEKEMHKIIQARNALNRGCQQAQADIRALVLQRKEEFNAKVNSRMKKIKTELENALPAPSPSDKSTERMREAVKHGMDEVKKAEPELPKGPDVSYFS